MVRNCANTARRSSSFAVLWRPVQDGHAGGQQYSLEEMKAIVDEAHMLGLKVAVHAHGTSGIKDRSERESIRLSMPVLRTRKPSR